MKISIAGPEDKNGIREVQDKTWLANTVNGESRRIFDDANKRSASSRDKLLSKVSEAILESDAQSRKNSLPGSETFVAKANQKVIGFCTVVRGSEQNSLAEINIIPEFQGKKVGRRLSESARVNSSIRTKTPPLRFCALTLRQRSFTKALDLQKRAFPGKTKT